MGVCLYVLFSYFVLVFAGLVGCFVVASVGFDERFIVRLIVSSKLGVLSEDVLLLVMPLGDDVRSLNVVRAVEKFIGNYGLKVKLHVLRVDVADFWGSAGKVRGKVEEIFGKHVPEKLIVLLSGGMRALILETLTGCIATGLKGEIIAYREDLKGYINFPLETFKIEKPPLEELNVLAMVRDGLVNLRSIASALGVSKTSAFRIIKRLEEKGLVRVEYRGRASKIVLTDKAKLWL